LNEPRPPALIFDCDGVLVDSEMLSSIVEAELSRELGVPLTVDEAHALFLGKTVEGVVEKFSELVDRKLSAGFIYNWAFATAHEFMQRLQPVTGILEAIAGFRTRNFAMAVASQSPLARVKLSLSVAGFGESFGEHVYVTSMVARPKPAPDIYLFAAEKLGTTPSGCIVIEDSPAGAAAAIAAGFQAIGYAPAETFDAMKASGAHVIRSMAELPGAIDRLSTPV
jgi:HAD superfamily hydrolase (TIGR01509 family)